MAKRIAVISLLLLYLTTSVGFAMTFHFCGQKLSAVQINPSVSKSCCRETAAKKNKCCKTRQVAVKVSDKQAIGVDAKIPPVTDFDLFILPVYSALVTYVNSAILAKTAYQPPPAYNPVPLTVRNCVFRI